MFSGCAWDLYTYIIGSPYRGERAQGWEIEYQEEYNQPPDIY